MGLIKVTGADGKVSWVDDGADSGILTSPIDGVTAIISGDALTSAEAIGVTALAAILSYGFGHHIGYKDRDAGKPKKLLGLI